MWRGDDGRGAICLWLRNLCRSVTASLEGYLCDDTGISQPSRWCHGYWGEDGGKGVMEGD